MVKIYIVSAPGIRSEEALGKVECLKKVSRFLDVSSKVLIELANNKY